MKTIKIQKRLRKRSKKTENVELVPEFIRPNNDDLLLDANISRRFLELFSPGY